ncbi:putative methyltransferase [Thiomonas sp. X19]|uniref:16S rRNA (guanine(966)-N(2))-methyltransferase RsmD n=1 Tax=Thiomonas sp. X19 TaxID=1050370 RepID=UPI000B74E6D5|nr:16S rRNA (guanine(966)-N(2))-methyltransferase RsmD [Thiomonas sp. X19]SCC92931.1 putative methyltransferase [Thiomonas sp. X19]
MPGKPSSAPKPRSPQPNRGPGEVRIIGGRLKRSKLVVAHHPGLRPTPDRVRETLFNWLGQDLTGLRCLDLFAGSGALGLEAASRGAAWVDLVERDAQLAKALTGACARLGVAAARVHAQDALQFAARCARGSYDIVFIDPPFALAASGLHAAALAAASRLLPAGGMAYIEAPDARQLAAWTDGGVWSVYRQDRAGQVHYAVLQRKAEAGAAE